MNKRVTLMRSCIWAAMLIICALHTTAQQPPLPRQAGIVGRVVDALAKTPVEYATITLLDDRTQRIISGTTTNNQGVFELNGLAPGNYQVLIEFIGYQPFRRKIMDLKKNALVDIKIISLTINHTALREVLVTASPKLIDNRIDKLVFNAEKDLTAQGGVATDMLKKIPQVSVDVDGNVQLAGNSSIRFLINGKPSSAFGSNIADVLQSLPASQIKAIEVITNPGAKYDAQGLGGIINIILKENTAKGVNGNLALTAGTLNESGSFNFNARKDNFGLNAFISGNARLSATTPSISDRSSSDTAGKSEILLHQDGRSRIHRQGYESGIGFDWAYKKHNNFSGSINYDHFGNIGDGVVQQDQTATQGEARILSYMTSVNNTHNSFRFFNLDENLTYRRTFDKEDQSLELAINNSSGRSRIEAGSQQYAYPQDSIFYGLNSFNPGTNHEIEVRADYSEPLKKNVILGFGGKLTVNDITSESDLYRLQLPGDQYQFDSVGSNKLNFHQKVYAAYAELSFPVKKLVDVKMGGRYERTQTIAYYSNITQQAPEIGYNTFVPSIYLSRKLTENQFLKLSYSQRIERPGYGDLNPFINTSDPKNLYAGNPYLKPETGNRIELSYNREFNTLGSFMVSLFMRKNVNDIQPFVVFYPTLTIGDQVFTNVSLSTRQNIGNEKNVGINVFGDFHVTNKLNFRSNFFMFHRHSMNIIDGVTQGNSLNYRLNANTAYQFNALFAAEFFINYNSARNEVQGKYPSYISYSFAMRKQIWNKKGSLALTCQNPFNQYVNQRTILYGNNFTINNNRRIPVRSVGINFAWKFGKLEFKQDKTIGADRENRYGD